MMGQLKTLLRVKSLKEEQALRALQAKRRQVEDGRTSVETATRIEAESRASLAAREDAIYDTILGTVINPAMLDDTRSAVVKLEKAHARLTDNVERAVHVLARLDKELDVSIATHRTANKIKDKYAFLLDDAIETATVAAEAAEENEVEDIFGTRTKERP